MSNADESPAPPRKRLRIFATVFAIFQVAGLLSAVNAVMTTRTSTGALAWSLSLVTAPMVAVPAYWVLGRDKFNGYVEAFQDSQDDFTTLIDEITADMDSVAVRFETRTPDYDAIRGLTRSLLVGGNRAELLIDGEQTFDSILDGILAAREYVLVQFYIVHDDGLGRRLKDAMIDRANAGVAVYFLYDELGSADLPEAYRDELRAAGVRVSNFNTTQGSRNRFQLNFRNHRKIVVVDGATAWIGGHNVGDEYLGLDEEFSPWRDTHVRLDGPVAAQAQLVVLADWYWAQREILELNWQSQPMADSNVSAMVIPTGPADPQETAGMLFVHALNSANDRAWITAPYFVPDEAVMKALSLATLRGVDVRILVPGKGDSLPVQLAAFHYMDRLKDSGIRFCAFEPGFMHQKVMLIDDHSAMVGTHNFDNRSFRLNFEVTALIYDEPFNAQVEQMLRDDLERCTPIDPSTFDDRSFFWRLGVNLSRLAAPVL